MLSFRDTHSHFASESQAAAVVAASTANGVTGILGCASTVPDSEMLFRAAEAIPELYFAAGIHPHEAENYEENAEIFCRFSESEKFRAVGEIGLDFYYDFADRRKQISVFEKMLESALELNLPASIHCRDKEDSQEAYQIAWALLRDFSASGGRFVIHSYSGTLQNMERFASLGSWFGVNGMITFRKADNIRLLAAAYPEDKILLETDSPYLAPVPHRGKENTPAYIPLIAEVLAQVRGTSLEEISSLTNRNAGSLFGF